MQLNPNVGTIDRFVRIAAAAALVVFAIVASPGTLVLWISLVVAAILGVTAIAGFCPLYAVLRLSTRPIRR